MQPLQALVNGSPGRSIDITDRGLHYGDGLFETVALRAGHPCLWSAHRDRLFRGADRLGIPRPRADALAADLAALVAACDGPGDSAYLDGVLRISLTRGQGSRGYRVPDEPVPTRIVAIYRGTAPRKTPAPAVLTLCRTRLASTPLLAGLKHLNRLEQVMARAEWNDDAILDGIMTDERGHAICGTMTNLFAVTDGRIRTPSLERCGVAGTVRALVLREASALGIAVEVTDLDVDDLKAAHGLFVTNALLGPVPVNRFADTRYDARALPQDLLERVRTAAFAPEMFS